MNTHEPNEPSPDKLPWADDALFYGTDETLNQLEQIARSAVDTIHQSDSARLVVIEAWILLDYAVREFLLSGLSVKKLSSKDFDLRNKLLPNSFLGCLRILKGLTKAQSVLTPPPQIVDHRVHISGNFLAFLENEHLIDSERFHTLEQEYYSKYHPELLDISTAIVPPEVMYPVLGKPPPEFSYINREWLKIAERLDGVWYSGANHLNDARNAAAHNYDQDQIFGSMGFAGPDAMQHLKDRCADLIQILVGVKKT